MIFMRRYLAFTYEDQENFIAMCPDFPEFVVSACTRADALRYLEAAIELEADDDTPAEDEAEIPNLPGIRVHLIMVEVEEV